MTTLTYDAKMPIAGLQYIPRRFDSERYLICNIESTCYVAFKWSATPDCIAGESIAVDFEDVPELHTWALDRGPVFATVFALANYGTSEASCRAIINKAHKAGLITAKHLEELRHTLGLKD